jgi:hypothetical protein
MAQYPRAAVATAQAHDAATAETNALAREQVRAYDLRTRGLAHGPSVHVESVHGTEVTLKLYNLPRQKLQALLTLLTEALD